MSAPTRRTRAASLGKMPTTMIRQETDHPTGVPSMFDSLEVKVLYPA